LIRRFLESIVWVIGKNGNVKGKKTELKLPDFALKIIEAGGLINKLAQKDC